MPPDVVAFLGEQIRNAGRFKLRVRRQDAEDLVQQTCELFLQDHAKIRPECRGAWFRSTLRHREIDLLQRQSRWKRYAPLLEAHVREHGPSCLTPDAALRQQAIAEAVAWLLEQVEPSRREVAARCLDDPRDLWMIAAEMGLPLGTVGSRWARAKADMRAALARERRKLDPVFFAVLSAVVAAIFLWLSDRARHASTAISIALGHGSRGSGSRAGSLPGPRAALAHGGGRARRQNGSPDSAAPRRIADDRRARVGAGAVVACALLPLALLSHAAGHERHTRIAASFHGAAGALVHEARREGDAKPDAARPRIEPRASTNAERDAWHDTDRPQIELRASASAEHGEDRHRDERVPGDNDARSAAPSPTVNREKGVARPPVTRASQAHPQARTTAPAPRATTPHPTSDADLEMTRMLLLRATASYEQGNLAIARAALKQYRRMYPENPYPALYARAAEAEHSR